MTRIKFCDHDYKNAIPFGKVDHICPKCKRFLDPGEWFFMNMFTFIDCTPKKLKKKIKRSVVTKQNFLSKK